MARRGVQEELAVPENSRGGRAPLRGSVPCGHLARLAFGGGPGTRRRRDGGGAGGLGDALHLGQPRRRRRAGSALRVHRRHKTQVVAVRWAFFDVAEGNWFASGMRMCFVSLGVLGHAGVRVQDSLSFQFSQFTSSGRPSRAAWTSKPRRTRREAIWVCVDRWTSTPTMRRPADLDENTLYDHVPVRVDRRR